MINRSSIPLLLCQLALVSTPALAVQTIKDSLYSETMDKQVDYVVVLPNSYATKTDTTFPVLYCLHGMGAPYDTWSVMLPLNRAIDGDYPAILVTFQGENSFYVDNKNDPKTQYTTFFFEELVPFIETTYRAGGKQELRGVTGFSMGGFGGWHYMLERPDFFSSVSSLSGAFNISPSGHPELNIYTQLNAAYESNTELPPMYLGCGTKDSWYSDNQKMTKELEDHGYSIEFVATQDAEHNWTYWRDASDEIIAFHYEHMSEPVALWKGFPVDETGHADTGDFIGQVYAGYQPWVWAYDLSKWMWSTPEHNEMGEWFWIAAP